MVYIQAFLSYQRRETHWHFLFHSHFLWSLPPLPLTSFQYTLINVRNSILWLFFSTRAGVRLDWNVWWWDGKCDVELPVSIYCVSRAHIIRFGHYLQFTNHNRKLYIVAYFILLSVSDKTHFWLKKTWNNYAALCRRKHYIRIP